MSESSYDEDDDLSHDSTKLMKLCYKGIITIEKLLELKHEIGIVDSNETTALMFYCMRDGKDPNIINLLSEEIGKQDFLGYTALMYLMFADHEIINPECVYILRNEIGLRSNYCETSLRLFCENHYNKLNKDLANQIVTMLCDEYTIYDCYNNIDIKSIIAETKFSATNDK